MDGSDDEAGDHRAAAETEVACNSTEREQGGALLRCDQREAQNWVRGSRDSESGAADAEQTNACQGRSTNAKSA
jgi:hypothetical protein